MWLLTLPDFDEQTPAANFAVAQQPVNDFLQEHHKMGHILPSPQTASTEATREIQDAHYKFNGHLAGLK